MCCAGVPTNQTCQHTYVALNGDTCDSVAKESDISKAELVNLNQDLDCTGVVPEGWTLCVLGWEEPETAGMFI